MSEGGAAPAAGAEAAAAPAAAAGTAAPAAPAAVAPAAAAAAGAGASGSRSSTASMTVRKDPVTVAEKCLTSYLAVYEQLSNAGTIFSTPQASVLLAAPLPTAAGAAARDQIKDPVDVMRVIHARILSSILPVWRHACLPACSPPVVAALVSILRVCAEGTSQQAVLALRAAGGAAAGAGAAGIGRGALGRPVFAPDPALVQSIVEMGFSAARAEEAIRRVGANSVEAAMEWLVMHPEEPPPPAPAAPAAAGGEAAGGAAAAGTAAAAAPAPAAPVQDDDTRLGATLAAALAGISETVADLTPPTAPPPIEATATSTTDAAGAAAPAAAPAAADAAAAAASAAAARGAVPGPEQGVEGARRQVIQLVPLLK